MELTTAVIPAAGKGTRLQPLTPAIPKELIPLGAQPALAYIMQEIVASQLDHTIVITNSGKNSITQYLDTASSTTPGTGAISYVHQVQPRGLGHAVLQARTVLAHQDHWALCLPDDIMVGGQQPALAYLAEQAHMFGYTMALAVQQVPAAQTSSYGIISIRQQLAPGVFDIQALVEKPHPSRAPSHFAIVGRYILTNDIFSPLHAASLAPSSGEIQLTDALQALLQAGHRILGVVIPSTRYDVGTLAGWFQAHLALSAQDPVLAPVLEHYILQQASHKPTHNTARRAINP